MSEHNAAVYKRLFEVEQTRYDEAIKTNVNGTTTWESTRYQLDHVYNLATDALAKGGRQEHRRRERLDA